MTLNAYLLSRDCLCTVLFIIVMAECPCNTYLFSYTDGKTDRLTDEKPDRQADRQVIKLKHFFIFVGGGGGGWGGCGYGVDGRKIHLGR